MAMWRNPYSQEPQDETRAPFTRQQLVDALEDRAPVPPRAVPRNVASGAAPVSVDASNPMSAGRDEGGYWTGETPPARTRVPPQGNARERLTAPGYQTSASFNDPQRTGELVREGYGGQGEEPEPSPSAPATATTPTRPDRTVPVNEQTGLAILDQFDDDIQRRGKADRSRWDSAGDLAAGVGLNVAMSGVGAPIGGAIAAVGGLMKLFGRTAKGAEKDFYQEDARKILQTFYQQAGGRDASDEEIEALLVSQGWKPGHRWVGEKGLAGLLNGLAVQFAQEQGIPPEEVPSVEDAAAEDATPATPGALGEYARNLEGFNMDRFADPGGQGNNTVKYQVGRVLSKYAPDANGLAQAAEELRGLGMDVQQAGSKGDLLVFGEGVVDDNGNPIGTIDVGRGFGAGGSGWAWQPQGGAGGGELGDAPADLQGAYEAFINSGIDPNASREEMESVIAKYFANVPGFEKAYKESVIINGQPYDLVQNYGGPGAAFQLMKKNDSAPTTSARGNSGGASTPGVDLSPGATLSAPLGDSDVYAQIQAALQRIMNGAPTRDELLSALGG